MLDHNRYSSVGDSPDNVNDATLPHSLGIRRHTLDLLELALVAVQLLQLRPEESPRFGS
jgi:hypothetical protein